MEGEKPQDLDLLKVSYCDAFKRKVMSLPYENGRKDFPLKCFSGHKIILKILNQFDDTREYM